MLPSEVLKLQGCATSGFIGSIRIFLQKMLESLEELMEFELILDELLDNN